ENQDSEGQTLDTLAIVNLGAVLIGTIGGFGILFSLLVTGWIRAYNRINVFIAFFSLCGAALALTPLVRRLSGRASGAWLCSFGLAAVLSLGIWDQTSPEMVPDYPRLSAGRQSDMSFVRNLEAGLTPGAMVFQIPYIAFPEALPF